MDHEQGHRPELAGRGLGHAEEVVAEQLRPPFVAQLLGVFGVPYRRREGFVAEVLGPGSRGDVDDASSNGGLPRDPVTGGVWGQAA